MPGIAEAAEVSVKTIDRHFENKDELLSAVIAGGMRRQWDSAQGTERSISHSAVSMV
jgi:AcrR family transcriptional regulator